MPRTPAAPARPLIALLVLALTALALLCAAPGASASARPIVGVGEQSARIFTDPHWQTLGLQHVRVVAAWDALESDWQREELDAYVTAAQVAGAKVLMTFGVSRDKSRRRILPSPERYRKVFKAFRERYPSVTEFITWNEANHCSQPTCHRPEIAAKYYNRARQACRTCKILAPSVLDLNTMGAWVREFEKHANGPAPTWGLHNYIDANRLRSDGTRALLRATRGDIWFTETGGIVKRRGRSPHKFPENRAHAAKATRWVFKLAALSSRIKRVYFYHWIPNLSENWTWDSALLDRLGNPRPAYDELLRHVVRQERARR